MNMKINIWLVMSGIMALVILGYSIYSFQTKEPPIQESYLADVRFKTSDYTTTITIVCSDFTGHLATQYGIKTKGPITGVCDKAYATVYDGDKILVRFSKY
jgi:hypothetical protein